MFNFLLHNELLTSVAFRLVLIASLWQGPIVWGHSHEQGTTGLARHIEQFHDGHFQCGVSNIWNLSWHWHCSLPNDAFSARTEQFDFQCKLQCDFLKKLPSKPLDQVKIVSFDGSVAGASVVGYLSYDRSPTSMAVRSRSHSRQATSLGFITTLDPEHAAQYVLCKIVC